VKPSVADPGQDFEGEALSIFQFGNTGSGASSANDTEQDDWGDPIYSSSDGATNPLSSLRLDSPVPYLAPDTSTMFTAASMQDELFSTWLTGDMDIDESPTVPASPSLMYSHNTTISPAHLHGSPVASASSSTLQPLSLTRLPDPLPVFPPTHFNELSPSSQGDNFPVPFLPRSSRSGRGTTPFAFRGGALCIVPPHHHSRPREIVSLNSDDEQNQHVPIPPDHQHADAPTAQDSNSPLAPHLLPASSGTDQQSCCVVSTPPTSTIDATASSGSHWSTKKRGCTPAATAAASNLTDKFIMQADELIKRGATFADRQHEEKARRRDAHYHDKAAERAHEERTVQVNAEQAERMQAFEMKMAELKLKQLDRELELAKVRSGGNVGSSLSLS
jgi:hypothetical protein